MSKYKMQGLPPPPPMPPVQQQPRLVREPRIYGQPQGNPAQAEAQLQQMIQAMHMPAGAAPGAMRRRKSYRRKASRKNRTRRYRR